MNFANDRPHRATEEDAGKIKEKALQFAESRGLRFHRKMEAASCRVRQFKRNASDEIRTVVDGVVRPISPAEPVGVRLKGFNLRRVIPFINLAQLFELEV